MEQANKIEYNNLKWMDLILIDIDNFRIPVRITRRTDATVWVKKLKFCGLVYEDEEQHALYYNNLYENKYEEIRLSKQNKKGFYKINASSNTLKISHKANTIEYKLIDRENDYKNI